MNDRDKQIVEKILKYCREIKETHTHFQDDASLFHDEENGFVYRNSITMPILQIGELAKYLSDEFISEHSDIPWKEIKGMRDIFAHRYGSIDYGMVWNTSHADIDSLNSHLSSI